MSKTYPFHRSSKRCCVPCSIARPCAAMDGCVGSSVWKNSKRVLPRIAAGATTRPPPPPHVKRRSRSVVHRLTGTWSMIWSRRVRCSRSARSARRRSLTSIITRRLASRPRKRVRRQCVSTSNGPASFVQWSTVPGDPRPVARLLVRAPALREVRRGVLRPPDRQQVEREQLLPRPAVPLHHGRVHGEEPQGLLVVDAHGDGALLEQREVDVLGGLAQVGRERAMRRGLRHGAPPAEASGRAGARRRSRSAGTPTGADSGAARGAAPCAPTAVGDGALRRERSQPSPVALRQRPLLGERREHRRRLVARDHGRRLVASRLPHLDIASPPTRDSRSRGSGRRGTVARRAPRALRGAGGASRPAPARRGPRARCDRTARDRRSQDPGGWRGSA